ncbi:glycine cleavage system protein GcvH [Rhodovarius lipocyclicus]|jgi:glycine cleavage system H protein|uniref:glycine cleavage system protein GcvH n=1 Tax=Rhodovarius lipocyclicus TaxID=268410 RepID=UPI0013587039|nr:glycine cleavage system protein GcvH [Rhodovarius lipocyclicus]
MAEMKYSKDHEWLRLEGGVATVGITDHAQTALGDVVFVELPETGRVVEAGEAVAVVESVKAASDVYAPIAGKVVAVNEALVDNPGTINTEPTGEGWFFKIELAGDLPADLMDEAAYLAFVDTL